MSFLAHWYYMYNSYLWGKIEQKCAIDLSFFLSSFPLFPHLSFLVCRYSITLSFWALGKASSVFLHHSPPSMLSFSQNSWCLTYSEQTRERQEKGKDSEREKDTRAASCRQKECLKKQLAYVTSFSPLCLKQGYFSEFVLMFLNRLHGRAFNAEHCC